MRRPPPVIHPFMVTSLFVLVCYREVQPFVKAAELLGIWLGSLVATYILYRIIKWCVTEPYKAALLTTLTIVALCFSRDFGGSIKRAIGIESPVIIPSFTAACALTGLIVLRTRKNLLKVKMLLNLTISAMAVATVARNHLYPVHFQPRRERPNQELEHVSLSRTNNRPDIYYLIFDSYTGAESLQTYWHFDNTPLVSFLQTNDFLVVTNAHSNYDQTPRCIASALNMNLLKSPPADLSSFGRHNRLLEMIDLATVPRTLREIGYQIVNLSLFDLAGEDQYYRCNFIEFSSLPDVMLQKSLFGYIDLWYSSRSLKHVNENIVSRLRSIPAEKSAQPRFVYAHVMMPHMPFFYDRNGPLRTWKFKGDSNDFLEQLIYANTVISNVVTDILQKSPAPPVIVLQGDHGFRFLHGQGAGEEGTTILNSYHLPGAEPGWVPDGITPANTFRMIFNRYFGANLAYVPNISNVLLDREPVSRAAQAQAAH